MEGVEVGNNERALSTCECGHPPYAHKVIGIHTTGYEYGPCTRCACYRYTTDPDTPSDEGEA